MTSPLFDQLDQVHAASGPEATLDRLIAELRADRDYHRLFDALLMKTKFGMGLPVTRPTSFDDVSEPHKAPFEEAYIVAAREVGSLLLAEGKIAQAWMYFRTLREPEPVARAIEALPPGAPVDEEIIDIAFFQGVAPKKGLDMLLHAHGTCSTITSLDQSLGNMDSSLRAHCAATMVRHLYEQLRDVVQSEVQKRQPMLPPGQSLKELIAGRDWLFADGNYHIDVSHLNSVVRFARSLTSDSPELKLALQLALYGSRLASQYQYAGSAPFEDFYPSHMHYFKVLLGEDRDTALAYFEGRTQGDPQDSATQLSALALVDLYQRLGRDADALAVAVRCLADSGEQYGVSLADLAVRAGRFDQLKALARAGADPLSYTAALVQRR